MGLCQGSCERMGRLCQGKAPETVVEYQNIAGLRTSFVSEASGVGSKVSLKKSRESESGQNSQTRQALNDIYNRLDHLSQKFDSVGHKLALDLEEEEDLKAQLQDIVFRTHLVANESPTKHNSVVFHSQDVSKAVPVRFSKRQKTVTFVNRLSGVQSAVVDRVRAKRTFDIQCKSLGADRT